jgi:hypothetical protein
MAPTRLLDRARALSIRGEYIVDIPSEKVTKDMFEVASQIVRSKTRNFEPKKFEAASLRVTGGRVSSKDHGKGLVGKLLERHHAALGEHVEPGPHLIADLNAFPRHRCLIVASRLVL